MVLLAVMVRDSKTKTNHEHEFFGYDAKEALEDGKEELDILYPKGYTISITQQRKIL
jgi:hypothetical protein